MIAGLLVVLAAGAAIAALLLVERPAPTGASPAGGAAPGLATPAPSPVEDDQTVLALTTNMYDRPTRASDLLAIIPEGRIARVTGRTDDSEWLRVTYPLRSGVEGWVPAAHARVDALPDLAAVPAVAPGANLDAAGVEGSVSDEEDALPDFTVSSAELQPDGTLVVRVTNVGRGAFSGEVDLQISTAEGDLLGVLDADLTQSPLGPGRSASVGTSVVVRETGLVVIEVDHQNQVDEANESNNSRRVLLVGVGG